MTQLVMEMAAELSGERLVLALEGGYNSEALQDSVTMVLWELTGQSVINKEEMRQVEDARYENIRPTIEKVKAVHKKYWSNL